MLRASSGITSGSLAATIRCELARDSASGSLTADRVANDLGSAVKGSARGSLAAVQSHAPARGSARGSPGAARAAHHGRRGVRGSGRGSCAAMRTSAPGSRSTPDSNGGSHAADSSLWTSSGERPHDAWPESPLDAPRTHAGVSLEFPIAAQSPPRFCGKQALPREGDLKERCGESQGCMRPAREQSRDDRSMSTAGPSSLQSASTAHIVRAIASFGKAEVGSRCTSITRPCANQDVCPMRRTSDGPEVVTPYGALPAAS